MSTNNTKELAKKRCIPCEGGIPPMKGAAVQQLLLEVGDGWRAVEDHHLEKEFEFPDFRKALDFTIKAGEIAEEENHHPDILLSYGKAKITIFTHKINGLSEGDFILAAKIEEAFSS